MKAVDTNVLFSAHHSRDPNKQKIAAELIASLNDGALLWQLACKYLWASRKLEALGYSYSDAVEDIRYLRRAWSTILPDWTVLNRTDALRGNYSLSFWDALLIASCLEAGVEKLFSEDFSSYRLVDTLHIVNPF
jgi:predicted nucleic acid-binding protein